MMLGPAVPDYAEQLTLRILLSLGMERSAAEQAVTLPLPKITWQSDGLIGEILRMSTKGR